MRRLTLILSDLYLPSEIGPSEIGRQDAGGNLSDMQELPALEWLLRFADPPQPVGDWRAWLLARQGLTVEANWLATPVALEARLDHVRLLDRGLLRLDPSERASCREEFARIFGPQHLLQEGGERAFLLSGLSEPPVYRADPARFLGSEIGPALPGREAGELRRLWTEIEMWLQGAAFNAVRARAGKRPVSALWLWGMASSSASREGVAPSQSTMAFYGGDPLIAGLGERMGGGARGAPREWAQIDTAASQVVIEFAALTGAPDESLTVLDANWFAPARAALISGRLPELELLANDCRFRIGARAHWKFWRARQPWLARLGPSAHAAKA
jgi:hypothetical protein